MTQTICEPIGKWMNATQIAQSFGLSRSGIFNLIKDGRFPQGIKIGNSRRWNVEDVRAWIEAQKGDKTC